MSHDPTGSVERSGPGRARAVQPGDRRRRLRLLLGHGRDRPGDRATIPEGIEAQTEQALGNLAAVLEAAGASMADVVKTTIFYADVEDFGRLNEVYARHMPDPPPARSAPANVRLPAACSSRSRRSPRSRPGDRSERSRPARPRCVRG